ncbi:hypothetical protein P872_05290 [Rhodonellum psychrophilum GCM71 = DSM 17998]|uniref:Uncharacterized protein n=1 Tax=Rhodonellum psychrophilum GCM71 = DSM 17998 TaxID=1123057 RepID=U5BYF9_9BACT|nr:hypothetical protein P872_05290 [Rhodonellum psychrophilum GCM71 = DSM 17998]
MRFFSFLFFTPRFLYSRIRFFAGFDFFLCVPCEKKLLAFVALPVKRFCAKIGKGFSETAKAFFYTVSIFFLVSFSNHVACFGKKQREQGIFCAGETLFFQNQAYDLL